MFETNEYFDGKHSDIDIFLLFVTIACIDIAEPPAADETRFILRT